MIRATFLALPCPGSVRAAGLALALAVGVLLPAGTAAAQEAPVFDEGVFITVRNPITSEVVNRIKAKVRHRLEKNDQRLKIVFDFNPDRHPSSTEEYGPCRDLADFLLDLQNVATIAFVHNEVTGHTVLPVLACREIVMASEARLGDVLRDAQAPLRKDQVQFYDEVARGRGRSPAVVAKMFDRELEVVEATRMGAVWYIDRRREAEEAQRGIVATRREPVLPAGSIGLYGAAQAQKLGLCQLIRESRQEVAEAYQMPAASLREDPLEGRTPVARRIEVRGPVNKALAETLRRRIRKAIAQKINFIILQLECQGGDTQVARDLADYLRDLKDDEGDLPVMTVAYIPERAPDTAVFLAFGCTEIVMRKGAVLGDFDALVLERQGQRRVGVDPARYRMKRDSLVGLAEAQGYPGLVARAMLDKDMSLYRVQSVRGPSEWRLVSGEDLRADALRDQPKWGNPTLLKPGEPNGEFLRLKADMARELGIAREVVDGVPELCEKYGIDRLRDAGPDWLDDFATFLRHPAMAVFLVMVGIACLILELKMPGVGLPGVVAALCFVLYFWAHSQLAGQITMLAVLLFVLGLLLVGVEIFILPGFGVTGISGIFLVLASLVLVTLEKKPETTQEWLSVGKTLSTFGMGAIGAVVLALVGAWYLPHIPYFGRLVLKPPAEGVEEEAEGAAAAPAHPAAALLGAIGMAITPLRPAGMVRFGDEFVDVVAEGSYVPAGNRVQVVEIEGNRIVVKEV